MPGTYYHDAFETTWGWVGISGSEGGIRYATLPEPTCELALTDLKAVMRSSLPTRRVGAFENYRVQLTEYLNGARSEWNLALDLDGATPFFKRAWEACSSIPPGETRTYQWLAELAGNPKAARGAGQAMARNRVPIVIPCHRVIGKDGGLHGFAGPGLPMKARLLALEARRD